MATRTSTGMAARTNVQKASMVVGAEQNQCTVATSPGGTDGGRSFPWEV